MFPKAVQVTDRFHVQKISFSLQEIRIKHRWEAMDKENQGYYNLNHRTKHISQILVNGDTVKHH
jgi:hypothetical protein